MKRKDDLLKLKSVWKKRKMDPIKVAEVLSKLKEYSPHKIACELKSHPIEVVIYTAFSCLSPESQKYFKKYQLPLTISLDLSIEEPSFQEEVLQELCNNLPSNKDVIDKFEAVLGKFKSKKHSWWESINGNQLMHISSKAKNLDLLSSKQRQFLHKMGKKINWGDTLSPKQRLYLNDILEKCKHQGILNRSCFNKDCKLCNEIATKIENR